MNLFTQIKSVTVLSLTTLTQRIGTSLVIMAGTAGMVAVIISIQALASGLEQTIAAAGRDERAIVVYRGSQSESASSIPREQIQTLLDQPGIRTNTSGNLLATTDVIGMLWLERIGNPIPGSASFRGITQDSLALRPEFELIDGRMFEPGLKQVIIGNAARGHYKGIAIGDNIISNDSEWEVVGVFTSGGSVHESEIWSDTESVLSALHRNSFNSMTVWVGDDAGLEQLKTAIEADPTLSVDVYRETDFYNDLSNNFSGFLSIVAQVLGAIMAVGAVFGVVNSMYTAVSTRTVEIATLRAIGFVPAGIVVAVFAEAMFLAFIGALVGAALAWLFFNGNTVSTVAGDDGLAQVVFSLNIGVDALVVGIAWSLALGLIGGLFPAMRAARIPVVEALRWA